MHHAAEHTIANRAGGSREFCIIADNADAYVFLSILVMGYLAKKCAATLV
jgi:hypothetical protein